MRAATTSSLSAIADTTLRQQQTNQNRGTDDLLRLGWSQGSRALVRFDQAAITAAVGTGQLVSAYLEFWVDGTGESWGSGAQNVTAHRLTSEWTEAGVTWACAIDAHPSDNQTDCNPQWNGGTYLAAATATVPHTKETRGPVRFAVTADVAAYLAGTANRGWLLRKANESAGGRIDYASRQGATAAHAPRLVLVVETAAGGDLTPPRVAITEPHAGLVSSSPVLVTGVASDDVALASVTIDGNQVAVVNGAFQKTVELTEEGNAVLVEAVDTSGNRALAYLVLVLDTTPPTLVIDAPQAATTTNQETVGVTGTAADLNEIASLTVSGMSIPLIEGRFAATRPLVEGENTIVVEAVDGAGHSSRATLSVDRFSLPAITLSSPEDLSYLTSTTVDVAGSVSGVVHTVSVNGMMAEITGSTFVARGIPLLEGGNVLTATATDARGHVGSASLNVVRDLTPPRLTIDNPVDGARLFETMVTVSGLINDIVDGTVNAEEATVTVNGRTAAVANRSYLVEVPLVVGDNVLTAIAVDKSGNVGQVKSTVRLELPTVPRIKVVGGDRQQVEIGTLLPAPLTVALLDAAGLPVASTPIVFKVRGNDGSLDGGKRQLAVATDANGRASVHFTLGTRVGVGNQEVEASAVGFLGPALFRATASPGAPSLIVVDSGNHQVGVAGQALPRPLVAVVTDAGFNRLPGVPVRFRVTKGLGHFADGSQDLVVNADSDGRALVTWALDPNEGISNNVAVARIAAQVEGPLAAFVATGWVAGDAAQTSISGLVLDNSNQAVPGATIRIRDSALTAVTDESGVFRIASAPVGTVKLIVDGSTAQRPGTWPDLEFVLTTIPGRDNTLGMPIFLLPLDLSSGLFVDETNGGTLALTDLPGFALEIAPGSVTFPSGGRSGVVSVTVVHEDKVPMVPNFGQQPRLIVTIQPAGARFEPPARLTLPNVEGLAPGQVAELYSFDHDLGHFVSIGPGTVSENGSLITSNRGVGILKAGWHCCGFPPESGAPNSCPECTKCVGDQCDPKPKDGKACAGTPGKVCRGGSCVCAIPTNFHQTEGSGAAGILHFKYEWGSSTGSLADLGSCVVGEEIRFPSTTNIFVWPLPWIYTNSNPDAGEGPATRQFLTDAHSGLPYTTPRPATVTIQQNYYFKCPCHNNGDRVILEGPVPITRTIFEASPGSWVYQIWKKGVTSTQSLHP